MDSSSHNWQEVLLGELFRIKHGWAFKGEYFFDYGPYILLTPGNFNPDGGIKLKGDKEKYYTGQFPNEYLLKEGELLIVLTDLTQSATILGSPAFVPQNNRFLHNQRLGKVYDFSPNIYENFLYYLFNTQNVRGQIKGSATGATVKHTAPDRIYNVKVTIPPLPTQRKIASILSAYDDLIENNLRRIKILEEMAQNLYREWFVKFRFPGHENIRFVDSPIGRIPEGWEVNPLESLIESHIGGGWGKEEKEEKYTEPAWVIRGTDIPQARFCSLPNVPFRYHTISNLKSRVLSPGDIVFEVSGGSKDQPLGRTLLVSSELLLALGGKHVICASFCKKIHPNSKVYASEILYLSFLEAYESGEIEQYQVQSTGISNFKWTAYIEGIFRCVPPIETQNSFKEIISSIFSKIGILGRKNTNLRQTRDLLLPKLISGEVDVTDIDIEIPKTSEL